MTGNLGNSSAENPMTPVEKIRAKLFEKYKPQDFHIVESSEVIIPGIQSRIVDSKPSAGGLRYTCRIPGRGVYLLSVNHIVRSEFAVSMEVIEVDSRYTRFSSSCDFLEIGEQVNRFIRMLERD